MSAGWALLELGGVWGAGWGVEGKAREENLCPPSQTPSLAVHSLRICPGGLGHSRLVS